MPDISLSVAEDSSYTGPYGGIEPKTLHYLLGHAVDNRKKRCIYLKKYFSELGAAVYPAEQACTGPEVIALMFKDVLDAKLGEVCVLGNEDTDEISQHSYGIRGSNVHLAHVIDAKEAIVDKVAKFNGQFTFLTLTCNFNTIKNVVYQIDQLRAARTKLVNCLRNDYGYDYFWVLELHPKAGFFHLHMVTLGRVPYQWLNGAGHSGPHPFNQTKVRTDTGSYWRRLRRGAENFNQWLQQQDAAFENNSLDWDWVSSRKGKRRVGAYLTEYMVKQQSTSYAGGHGRKELFEAQQLFLLGLAYLLNLRLFDHSQGLSQRLDNSREQSVDDDVWVFLGYRSDALVEQLLFNSHEPPPVSRFLAIRREVRWHLNQPAGIVDRTGYLKT